MMKYYFFLYGENTPYPYYKQCKNDRGAKLAFRAAMRKHNATGGYVTKRVSKMSGNGLTSDKITILEV